MCLDNCRYHCPPTPLRSPAAIIFTPSLHLAPLAALAPRPALRLAFVVCVSCLLINPSRYSASPPLGSAAGGWRAVKAVTLNWRHTGVPPVQGNRFLIIYFLTVCLIIIAPVAALPPQFGYVVNITAKGSALSKVAGAPYDRA